MEIPRVYFQPAFRFKLYFVLHFSVISATGKWFKRPPVQGFCHVRAFNSLIEMFVEDDP
jgi:hypothetical protein